jgi:serine protease Do
MNINNTMKTALIAMATSLVTLGAYKIISDSNKDVVLNEAISNKGFMKFANLPAGQPGDFVSAASISAPSVVHIRAKSQRTTSPQRSGSIFDLFGDDMFGGPRSQNQESSGSGVIISGDGYIVTNNHVVEGADELEVITYNKKSYEATIIGTDPSTDIAVIKIQETKLPAITFSNSDDVKVGEWVLAVGNPFNLENTVTAGIVSAISRNIDILGNRQTQQRNGKQNTDSAIESFIQTDAAVNPGNSGGALVNLQGNLIGINTAIASPNGAFAGYSFAVPSSIVKKVSTDLIKFGNVQRGFIGLVPVGLDSKKAKEFETDMEEGIYVYDVPTGGAADVSGVKKGDVILKVDGVETKSEPKFRELIGRKRPGEKAILTINRNGSVKDYSVTLKNNTGGEGIVKKDLESASLFSKLGISLEEISDKDKEKLGLRNGVRIQEIDQNGIIGIHSNIEEGFIITRIGNQKVNNIKEAKAALNASTKNGEDYVVLCGTYQEQLNHNYCITVPFEK